MRDILMSGWVEVWRAEGRVDEWMTGWMSGWVDDPMNELVISVIHQFLNNEPAVPKVSYIV